MIPHKQGFLKAHLMAGRNVIIFLLIFFTVNLTAQGQEQPSIFQLSRGESGVFIDIGLRRFGPFEGLEDISVNANGRFVLLLQNTDRSFSAITSEGQFGPWAHPDSFGSLWTSESGGWSVHLISSNDTVKLIINGIDQGVYAEISSMSFSMDGKQWIAAVQGDEGNYSFKGPSAVPGYFAKVHFVNILGDGAIYAHVTGTDGGDYILAGGKAWGPLEVYATHAMYDAPWWAFSAVRRKGRDSEYIVVVNGEVFEGESLNMTYGSPREFTWITYDNTSTGFKARLHRFREP